VEDATRVAVATVLDVIPTLRSVRRIRFVLHDERIHRAYVSALDSLLSDR
jgi:hypothetical protein